MLRHWFDSLVNRAVVLVIAAIIVTALVVAVINSVVSRQELEAQARAQIEQVAGFIVDDLDAKLSQRFLLLNDIAHEFTMSAQALPHRAQKLIDRQIALPHLFDGVYLFDAEGTIVGEYHRGVSVIGFDATKRAYFQNTLQQLVPLISAPYASYPENRPVVMMTSPIFDKNKQLIGVLGGAIRLDHDNFMGEVSEIRLGKTGYVTIGTRDGMTLAHGVDAGQVMQPVGSGHERFADAMSGLEVTRFRERADGEAALLTIRQMNQAPWFVRVVWPVSEAFAPAIRLADMLLWIVLAVIGVLAPLAYWRFTRLMRPMGHLAQQITERHRGVRSQPVKVGGGREIRQVADIFNEVMKERTEVLESLADREAFFRSLSQSAPIGIVQSDVLGRIEFVNPAFEVMFGVRHEELLHSYLIRGIFAGDRTKVAREWADSLGRGRVFRSQFRVPHRKDERLVWVDVMSARIDTNEKTLGTITVTRDITHELEVEAQLKAEQQRAESILDVLQESVLLTDRTGTIRYANASACAYIGIDESFGRVNFFDVVAIGTEEETWSIDDFLGRDRVDSLDTVISTATGQQLETELTMLRLRSEGDNERLVFVLRDDSDRRRHEQRLSWEASHDSLTGLLNRRAFVASLMKWLAEASNLETPSVLMMVDLDQFKPVNDQGGHLLGDELLRGLAAVLNDAVRQTDTVARLGGDEFGVVLPACGLVRAEQLAEQVRQKVEALTVEQDGVSYGVTCSIGLTELSAEDSGPKETVARADEGLYAAKARGRNCVVAVPVPLSPPPR